MSDSNDLEAKRQQDFDDLQHEITGDSVGRISRFLSDDDPRGEDAKRRKKAKQAEADRRLMDLLKDPEFFRLYTDLGERLLEAEQFTDQAMADIEAQLAKQDHELEDMEARAAKGPNGQPVFRTANGRAVDANGEDLPPEIAAGIQWPATAPSAEEYFRAKAQQAVLDAHLQDLNRYRSDVLGDIRHRYADENTPMSKDDLQKALDDIDALRPELVSVAPSEAPATAPVASPAALDMPMTLN